MGSHHSCLGLHFFVRISANPKGLIWLRTMWYVIIFSCSNDVCENWWERMMIREGIFDRCFFVTENRWHIEQSPAMFTNGSMESTDPPCALLTMRIYGFNLKDHKFRASGGMGLCRGLAEGTARYSPSCFPRSFSPVLHTPLTPNATTVSVQVSKTDWHSSRKALISAL